MSRLPMYVSIGNHERNAEWFYYSRISQLLLGSTSGRVYDSGSRDVLRNCSHTKLEDPMGEAGNGALRLRFDRRLKLEFHGAKIRSDAGLLAYRELDEQFGLTPSAAEKLLETRKGKNTQHTITRPLGIF